MSRFRDSVLSLGPVLFHDYRLGRAHDLSPSGLAHAYAGGEYRRRPQGEAYVASVGTPGAVVVADTGAGDPTRLTSGTLLLFGDELNPTAMSGFQRLLSKRDAGGTAYDLLVDGAAGVFSWYDGVALRTTAAVDRRLQMVAVPFAHGATPTLYGDGTTISRVFSGTIQATGYGADLQIGRYYSGSSYLARGLYLAALLPVQLTTTELNALYVQWGLEAPSYGGPTRDHRIMPVCSHPALTAQYGRARTSTQWIDVSGHGNHATIDESVTESDRCLGNAPLKMPGRGVLCAVAHPATLDPLQGTIATWVRASNLGRFMAFAHSLHLGANRLYMYSHPGLGGADIRARLGTSAAFASGVITQPNEEYLCGIDWNNGNAELYVDGELTATSSYAGLSTFANDFCIGALTGFTVNSVHGETYLFNKPIGAAEHKKLYLEGAHRRTLVIPREYRPVTPTTITAPGHVGPWHLLTGSAEYTDDGERRRLVAVGATDATLAGGAGFGSYRFAMEKGADPNGTLVMFIASAPYEILRGPNQQGYVLAFSNAEAIQMLSSNAGAFALLGATATGYVANNTRYVCQVTRYAGGRLKAWIMGGAYTDWTLALDVTAGGTLLSYTEGKAVAVEIDAGDCVDSVEVRRGSMSPWEWDAAA